MGFDFRITKIDKQYTIIMIYPFYFLPRRSEHVQQVVD